MPGIGYDLDGPLGADVPDNEDADMDPSYGAPELGRGEPAEPVDRGASIDHQHGLPAGNSDLAPLRPASPMGNGPAEGAMQEAMGHDVDLASDQPDSPFEVAAALAHELANSLARALARQDVVDDARLPMFVPDSPMQDEVAGAQPNLPMNPAPAPPPVDQPVLPMDVAPPILAPLPAIVPALAMTRTRLNGLGLVCPWLHCLVDRCHQ